MAGLTPEGLDILNLTEVLDAIETSEKALIDPSINTQSDELLGQLNNIFSVAVAEQWELTQAVNDNFNPLKAEGKNLDDIGSIIGVARNDASFSSTQRQLFPTTVEGTIILLGSTLQDTNGNTIVTTEQETVDRGALYEVEFLPVLTGSTSDYTIVVSGITYTTNEDNTVTINDVSTALKALIDADTTKTWDATLNGDNLVVTTQGVDLVISGLLNVSISIFTPSVPAQVNVTGSITVLSNTATILISTIPNVTTTTNPDAYTLGGPIESDEDYRARILTSQGTSGAATVPAIEAAVADLSGVTAANIIENRTFVVDGAGRPPKSFETIVQGGADAAIAQTIWNKKPAGIETFGTTTIAVVDSSGAAQLINFSRPTAVNMAVRVSYTIYDEETFPATGEADMTAIIVPEINNLGVDVDVIPSRLYGPIYVGVSGLNISAIEIQVLANSGDAPSGGSWSELKQDIDFNEFASIADIDVFFVGP